LAEINISEWQNGTIQEFVNPKKRRLWHSIELNSNRKIRESVAEIAFLNGATTISKS
jgi:hypothetical protein